MNSMNNGMNSMNSMNSVFTPNSKGSGSFPGSLNCSPMKGGGKSLQEVIKFYLTRATTDAGSDFLNYRDFLRRKCSSISMRGKKA